MVDAPQDRLADTSFGALGTLEEAWAEDDGVCVPEMCDREFGETLGSIRG